MTGRGYQASPTGVLPFANDLVRAQLRAVADNVDQVKGDKDPACWKPPLKRAWCAIGFERRAGSPRPARRSH